MTTLTSLDVNHANVVSFDSPMARVLRLVRERVKARGLNFLLAEKCFEEARKEFQLSGGSEPLAAAAGQRLADRLGTRERHHAWRGGPDDNRPSAA